jgi:hypothetical protein
MDEQTAWALMKVGSDHGSRKLVSANTFILATAPDLPRIQHCFAVVPYPSAGAILNFTHLLFMRASFDL